MFEEASFQEASTNGYLSEASKRRFTITSGILGAMFLIAQFALPLALMMSFMAFQPGFFDVDFSRRSPEYVAIWDGRVWFVETETSFDDAQPSSTLAQTGTDVDSNPEPMADISGTPHLLAGDDRLWLITKTTFANYQDGQLTTIDQPTPLAEISRPFIFEDRPAVLERWPNELALVVHDGTTWQHRAVLPIVMPEPECGCGLEWTKAIADERGVHLFLEFGTSLYYGLWVPGLEMQPEWESVAETGEDWSPILLGDEPAVVRLDWNLATNVHGRPGRSAPRV